MKKEKHTLSIKTYLDFSQLLEEYRGEHDTNRAFALKRGKSLKNPIDLLLEWSNSNQFKLTEKLNSTSYLSSLSSITSILGLLFFIVGIFAGLGLLSYSGEEPVNIIYYLLIASVLPLLSILVSAISMMIPSQSADYFKSFFPLYWIEKIISISPLKKRMEISKIPLSPELSKWIFVERIQLLSLLFSIGLILSLLTLIVVKDIAFGWSSTLQVSSSEFQSLLSSIGILWEGFFPSAIPSLELVEISHYFRLGEKLDTQMIHNADKLGAWWKFLAMTTLLYAITLRFLFWLVSKYGLKRELEKELLSLKGVNRLQREFSTPFVSTNAPKGEKHLEIIDEVSGKKVVTQKDTNYGSIFGWNFLEDEILLINDAKNIDGSTILPVGGNSSFDEDEAKAHKAKGKTLVYVKAWEPPTMDFIDFLDILIENRGVDEIQVYPLGTVGHFYESSEKEIAVWERKIEGENLKKVWVVNE
jgi:hypothetical protein